MGSYANNDSNVVNVFLFDRGKLILLDSPPIFRAGVPLAIWCPVISYILPEEGTLCIRMRLLIILSLFGVRKMARILL